MTVQLVAEHGTSIIMTYCVSEGGGSTLCLCLHAVCVAPQAADGSEGATPPVNRVQ